MSGATVDAVSAGAGTVLSGDDGAGAEAPPAGAEACGRVALSLGDVALVWVFNRVSTIKDHA